MTNTTHFGLDKMGGGDSISDDGYKFSQADRDLIDLLLYYGATAHHHDGYSVAGSSITAAPIVEILPAEGFLAGGTTYYYKVSELSSGIESSASPATSITTTAPMLPPGQATLNRMESGGSLPPGQYFYVLSAWRGSNTQETEAVNPVGITLPNSPGSTQQIVVSFPTFPVNVTSGSYGFNVFRKGPSGASYQLLASVDISGATPSTAYTDNGSVTADCNRIAPKVNTSAAGSTVEVTFPNSVSSGGFTRLSSGSGWMVYRTTDPADWTDTLLATVIEPPFEGDTGVTAVYTDGGLSVTSGSPLSTTLTLNNPSKIDLATETSGSLLATQVQSSSYVEYSIPGLQTVRDGTFQWICPYVGGCNIEDVRMTLGIGYAPASAPLVIDIRTSVPGSGVYASIWANAPSRASIPVGTNSSPRILPSPGLSFIPFEGFMTMDVAQVGGGATPTDFDLYVQIRIVQAV